MKKSQKIHLLILIIAFLTFVGAACSPVALHDIGEPPPMYQNDLEGGTFRFVNEIAGECFNVVTEYSTEYSARAWRITDSKTLTIKAWIEKQPGCQSDVYMEHLHADVNLQATKPILDGWTQDSMDDSIHGSLQPGFWMSQTSIYEEIFAIEGYTETFISGWSYYNSYYGAGNIEQKRPTETELADAGVYGNRIIVVFDIAVGNLDGKYHGRSFVDEFLVPTKNYDRVLDEYNQSVIEATEYAATQEAQK